jgi:cytochrome c oxidase cbb3-type subunit 2
MLPRPRDFVQARYQVRTTGPGELPTDEDLRRILREGMPGTAMPAWPNLSDDEREDVIAYLKQFSSFFEDETPSPMEFSRDPGGGEEARTSGIDVYERLECWKCHGSSGRGDGQSAPTLEDWREYPTRAANLTEPWAFNGGMGAEAIHARFLTGLDGTPMPSYDDALGAGVVTESELWDLAHYVASMGPDETPTASDLILAGRVEGELPAESDDEAWTTVDAFYVPLVGQVIQSPRQFNPTVDGIWVQALHDGDELTVRLTWNDPSRSPDPSWDEWQTKIGRTLYTDTDVEAVPDSGEEAAPDSGEEAAPGAAGEAAPASRLADGLAVQFPPEIPDGSERPYFLMGDAGNPVSLWMWDSQTGLRQAAARGLGEIEVLGSGDLAGQGTFDAGQWHLTIRRSLVAANGPVLSFVEGVAIPIAFFAWDGSSAEDVRRGSVSGWYYLYLDAPRSAAVYTVPALATLLTAGFALLIAARARRKSEQLVQVAAQAT